MSQFFCHSGPVEVLLVGLKKDPLVQCLCQPVASAVYMHALVRLSVVNYKEVTKRTHRHWTGCRHDLKLVCLNKLIAKKVVLKR